MIRQGRRTAVALLLMATAGATLAPEPMLAEGIGHQLYVSTTGSDANPGTAQAPFRTIARAAAAAVPGSTVHVLPGVYEGGFKTVANGTADAPIRYRSDKKWEAKLVPPDHGTSEIAWDNRGDYVTIEGFEVDGTAIRAGVPWSTGIYAAGSHDVVSSSHVHHIGQNLPCTSHGGSGIGTDHYYYGVADDVIGNVVHDIGPKGCTFFHGIYISTSGNVINNVVHDSACVGIHLWHDATNVNIINNTVTRNIVGILVGSGDQYHSNEPDDYTKAANNIVVKNQLAGIEEHGRTGVHNLYLSNLVWENGKYDFRLQNGLTDKETIKGDPQFREDATDFHLQPGSPAIDRAAPSYAPAIDIDGVSRPQGKGYDIGAYEYAMGN